MNRYSTREAAKKLGIEQSTLSKYLKKRKVPSPETVQQGKRTSQIWTDAEIEQVRQLLPKIANGRKTRYAKLRQKQKAQPKKAMPRKLKKK
jgi:predicted DNA-binding transcriptional regulator AlpA